jgi:hypothetical protein
VDWTAAHFEDKAAKIQHERLIVAKDHQGRPNRSTSEAVPAGGDKSSGTQCKKMHLITLSYGGNEELVILSE